MSQEKYIGMDVHQATKFGPSMSPIKKDVQEKASRSRSPGLRRGPAAINEKCLTRDQ